MTQKAKCKFCQREILLVIDEEYAGLGDPFGLAKLAACDRCADLMIERRRIFYAAKSLAMSLLWQRAGGITKEQTEKLRAILTNVMKKWFRLVSEWRDNPMIVFDDACVEMIMDKPQLVGEVLKQCWVMK